MRGIAVLDAGGQYCHLLARRVRELGVQSHVLPIHVTADQMRDISGVIISGGPRSVTEPGSPRVHASVLTMNVPVLGICYGHQLLAATLPGGLVKPSASREYGIARLTLATRTGAPSAAAALGSKNVNGIFAGFPDSSRVWMSHGDSVVTLPDGFEVLGMTEECPVAAMGNTPRRLFGVQFHPEVTHTECGRELLRNFVTRICNCEPDWRPSSAETIESIKADIRANVGDRTNVLFFVSGGVDSTVAYKLCSEALGHERVHGVYVDTGFMRKNESAEVMQAFEAAGFRNVRLRDASSEFLGAVGNEVNPETKRKLIGAAFLSVENDVLEHLPPIPAGAPDAAAALGSQWLLGQGTIYPDTIESGGTHESALIKTHHNRIPELMRRIQAGEVVEPLAQFYKDEVREIGRALGLPAHLIQKQPFPGPGLAVRFLGSGEHREWEELPELSRIAAECGFGAKVLPVRSVGVQGDERTYAHIAVLTGDYNEAHAAQVSRAITNSVRDVNRVAFWAGAKGPIQEYRVEPTVLSRAGLDLLREADAVVREILAEYDTEHRIWQCPVVLLPLKRQGGFTVAIRPVESHDGMTAQYSKLPPAVIARMTEHLLAIPGIGAWLYDVTNKPPGTIEWE